MRSANFYRIGEVYKTNQGYSIEIIEYITGCNITVRFNDVDDTIVKNIRMGAIRNGEVLNPNHRTVYGVGYIGIGKYKPSVNSKDSKFYSVWKDILRRCYDEKFQIKNPSYLGCSVAVEWHNFQNFAQWFEENYNPNYMQGWAIDKDILVKENKIYSPETCCFVPVEINSIFIKRQKIELCLQEYVSIKINLWLK